MSGETLPGGGVSREAYCAYEGGVELGGAEAPQRGQ
jgi:hypothetical protein